MKAIEAKNAAINDQKAEAENARLKGLVTRIRFRGTAHSSD